MSKPYDEINLSDREPEEYCVPDEGPERQAELRRLYIQFREKGDDRENAYCRLMAFATASEEEAKVAMKGDVI